MAKKNEKTSVELNSSNSTDMSGKNGIEHASQNGLGSQDSHLPELLERDITDFVEISARLEQELSTIVVGQERVIRELMLALLAGGHVLLEGVPGLGKT